MDAPFFRSTRDKITTFIPFLQSRLRERGNLLRRSTLLTVWVHLALLTIFSVYVWYDRNQKIQREAIRFAAHVENTFLLEVESVLEEMMIFGKERFKDSSLPSTSSDRTLSFEAPVADHGKLLFHWALHFDQPIISQETGLWTIPASLALLNTAQQQTGKIVKQINMRTLTRALREKTYQVGMVFAIIDPRWGALFQSENNPGDHKSLIYRSVLEYIAERDKGSLQLDWRGQDTRFLAFSRLPKHPYVVVTGVKPSYLNALVLSGIFLLFPYAVLSLFLCLMVLWGFGYQDQEGFRRYREVLRKHFLMFAVESVVDTLKSCRISETKIRAFGPKAPVFMEEELNLNEILDTCLLILGLEIASKGIRVKKLFADALSRVVQNHFEIQKIFLNLLGMSVETSKKRGLLVVKTSLDHDKIVVKIEDEGFHLGVNERLGFADLKPLEFTETSFKSFLQSLEDMEGKLSIAFKADRGHILTVELPARMAPLENDASNVIDLKKAAASRQLFRT